jgi:hypothetical protein
MPGPERGRLRSGARGTLSAQAFFMSKLLRGIAAGYGAKKLGGGCFTTILVFLLLWWLLGSFEIFR